MLGTVTSRKNVGGRIESSIVGLFSLFLGSMGFICTLSLHLRWCPLPLFRADTIYLPPFSLYGLDKVAHVSHFPGPASVRGIGQPAFPAVDGYLALAPPQKAGLLAQGIA